MNARLQGCGLAVCTLSCCVGTGDAELEVCDSKPKGFVPLFAVHAGLILKRSDCLNCRCVQVCRCSVSHFFLFCVISVFQVAQRDCVLLFSIAHWCL